MQEIWDLFMTKGVDALLPIVVGIVVPYVVDLLKKTNTWLAGAPAFVKQLTAFLVSAAALGLSKLLGTDVPVDLVQWDGVLIQTVVAGLLGIAIKQQRQLKPQTPTN